MKDITFKTFVLGCLLATIFFAGCSIPYRSKGFVSEYDEVQIAENIYRVSLRDTGYASSDGATNLCMLKCAELALGHGFKYFSIVEHSENLAKSNSPTPSTSGATETNDESGSTGSIAAATTPEGEQTYNIARPSTSNTIVCHKVYPSKGFAYDAQFVYNSLGLKSSSRQDDVAREINPPRHSSVQDSRSFPKFLKIEGNSGKTP